ncbi:helix-turn-helix domain-containing protein [Shewanella electrodiphila]|uniref:Helix-turn-helix domain-containing protein n=1 Tax=Shewanella electrodiphila TaxID=934143 RepID=A0ABT0KUM6_9GAMM|nr:helix-turn-helix domain-containing protein [Shewanella electrodiphila]MCL1047533.1 helix-turn-helix domain-containing protein [Shewanella electrodiphila]
MMGQHNHKSGANKETRLCQQVASSHQPEAVLNSSQIAKRLGRSTKTIGAWLRSPNNNLKAFKCENEWHVYQSDFQSWEQSSH